MHFQAVAERYAPYETILEISHADELSDTSLASSFPLHTASPALSTTRLDEISEDAEDGAGSASPQMPARTNSAKFGTARYKTERRVDQLMRAQQSGPSSPLRGDSAPNPSASPAPGLKPSISQFLVREDSGTRSITSISPSVASVSEYAGSIADSEITMTKETESTPSTVDLEKAEVPIAERQIEPTTPDPVASIRTPSIREPSPARSPQSSERPLSVAGSDMSSSLPQLIEQKSTPDIPQSHFEEPFDFSYLEPKPKVKLGPRPVVTPERPRKSGTLGTSLLPAGYLAKKQEQQRPKSTGPVSPVQAQMLAGLAIFPTPPPIPAVPEYIPRPVSRGSVKSMPSQKSTTMTPEKLRLMKAVELRKRQMRKGNPEIKTQPPAEKAPVVPDLPRDNEPEEIERSFSSLPDSVALEAPKPDSGIDLENAHSHECEMQNRLHSPSHCAQSEAETVPEPAELLSAPIADLDSTTQPTGVEVDTDNHVEPEEVKTDEQQVGGAEISSDEPSQSAPTSEAMHIVSPTPASEAEPNQAAEEVKAEEIIALPTEVASSNANAVDQTVDQAVDQAVDQTIDQTAFSTMLENLITDLPEIVTTASSRPQTAEDEVRASLERSPSPLESGDPATIESSGVLVVESELSYLAKRRRGLVEPLHIDVETRRDSEAESLTDNELLEELQSATFHDAKEMVVSKSPGPNTSFFPSHSARSTSRDSADSQPRSPVKEVSISNGLPQIDTHPTNASTELIAQPHSGKSSSSVSPVDRLSPVASLKRNVSSGITKRIQALNELSNREPNAVPVHIPTRAMSPDPAPVFLANDRRPSMRAPHSRPGSYRLRPNTERAGSFTSGSQPDIAHVWNTSQDTTNKRGSVSVKARIVRPPTAGSAEKPNDTTNDLHESQIEINHSRGTPTPTPVSQAFLPPMATAPTNPPSPDHRSLHSPRRKSFGRSKAATPGPVPANEDVRPGSASIISTDEPSGSRTSRFFKRMSNFGNNSSKRRSIVLPGVASPPTASAPFEPSASRQSSVAAATPTTTPATTDRDTPPAVQVGDLNVQFPDTLVSPTIMPLPLFLKPTKTNTQNPRSSGNAAGSPSMTPATYTSPHPPPNKPKTTPRAQARNSTSPTSERPTLQTLTARNSPTASASNSPPPHNYPMAMRVVCCNSRVKMRWARGRC